MMASTADDRLNQRHRSRLRPLRDAPADGLVVHEIYASIQGESSYVGLPCTFVRTSACHLRCLYCDTPQAFSGGVAMSLPAIVERVRALGCGLVEITGGEPLLQAPVHRLMTQLCDAGYRVLLETSGSLDLRGVDARVIKIVDIKTPSSGEVEATHAHLIEGLAPTDEIKFVLGGRDDYVWARELIRRRDLASRCQVLLGPVFGQLEPRDLAGWIMEDLLPVRLQLQVHKFIWHPDAQGV